MNDRDPERLAAAILYEGYLLYPYRPSTKNTKRWTLGGLHPLAFVDGGGPGNCRMRANVLVEGEAPAVGATLRFLQIQERTVGRRPEGTQETACFPNVPELDADGVRHLPWQEGLEREWSVGPHAGILGIRIPIEFRAAWSRELVRDVHGAVVGDLVRECRRLTGEIHLQVSRIRPGLFLVSLEALNDTPLQDPGDAREAERCGFMAAHALLRVENGRFLSMTDPPSAAKDAAQRCANAGCWPVLVGDPSLSNRMLASPIILPDFPALAPESPGDLFDGTEIDEILSLRIQTLTDEEKGAMAALDPRGRAILERTDALSQSQWGRLHGALRSGGGIDGTPE